MKNRLNANRSDLGFVTAFWFVIHVCDSSLENSIERTLNPIPSSSLLFPLIYMYMQHEYDCNFFQTINLRQF